LKGKINELATNSEARILETCREAYMNLRWLILRTSGLLWVGGRTILLVVECAWC